MKRILPVICCALILRSAFGGEAVNLGRNTNARYLDKAALEAAILTLENLKYPLTRAESLSALRLGDRQLPSLVSMEPTLNRVLPEDQELIRLTDPEKKGRSYSLLLWYDPSARSLSGDSFVKAKIINYAEIVVEDDGTADAPKAKYVVQSSRYPYLKLAHPREGPTKKEANQASEPTAPSGRGSP